MNKVQTLKNLYKITWMQAPDKNGNRLFDYTTIRRESLIQAIKEVCEYFEIDEKDIVNVERKFN